MDNDALDLKRRLVSPAAVASAMGLAFQKANPSRVKILCPAHGERTPSCSLTVGDDNTLRVHCFACRWGGDVFSLIAMVYRIDAFPAVLMQARTLAGIDPSTPLSRRPPPPVAPPPSQPPRLDDSTFAALAATLLALCPLAAQPDGSAYLDGRGILAEAHADGWGCLPLPWGQRVVLDALRAAHGDEALGRSGLVPLDRETDEPVLARFAQGGARLLIPWRAVDGTIATLERRRLDAGGEGRPRYVATRGRSPSSLYGAERVASAPPGQALAIVEGAADTLARRALLAATGRPAERVVGLPGAGVWRADLLPPLPPRSLVYAATDADATGDGVAEAIARAASEAGHIPIRKRPRSPAKDWGAALEALLAARRAAATRESGEKASA